MTAVDNYASEDTGFLQLDFRKGNPFTAVVGPAAASSQYQMTISIAAGLGYYYFPAEIVHSAMLTLTRTFDAALR